MAEFTVSYDNVVQKSSESMSGRAIVLGKEYHLPKDHEEFLSDVKSRIWCTYRKNFKAISGSHISSDAGWGCTIRCGQMLLAQAIVCQHLGRDWRWTHGDNNPLYMKILSHFLDTSTSNYSIQLIALHGVDLGRPLGHWFGPNNIAQVIKKLSAYDEWNQMAVHVAMDMLVITDDIMAKCRQAYQQPCRMIAMETQGTASNDKIVTIHTPSDSSDQLLNCTSDATNRSVLLLIPLRLGQDHYNTEYTEGIKACFHLPQFVGIIGGRPRHALWFIGYKGDHLIYLDPHTTQPVVKSPDLLNISDQSYHCSAPGYMKFSDLDPSLSLGFFCKDEKEFTSMCDELKGKVLCNSPSMFEIVKERPSFWDICTDSDHYYPHKRESYLLVESDQENDDSFEIIELPNNQ